MRRQFEKIPSRSEINWQFIKWLFGFWIFLLRVPDGDAGTPQDQVLPAKHLDRSLFFPTKAPSPRPETKKEGIRLDGFLFESPQKWCIWLNGQPLTDKNDLFLGVSVSEISPDSVLLRYKTHTGERTFSLKPGETFLELAEEEQSKVLELSGSSAGQKASQ